MKKIYFFISLALLASNAFAQYVCTPYLNANTNPGGLNADTEYPVGGGLSTSWTSIHAGSAASPAWSTTVTLPFSFSFSGVPVTSYKVATSGILTFSTSAATAPAYTPATLPNAAIPDNSVVAWGIQGSGSNDNICHKTFGTAPNRQHWVLFTSYSMPPPAASTCYTYWAIVLEESSNAIYIVDQRHNCTAKMTLGVQTNATTAVQVAGAPTTASVAGLDPTSDDNTYYEFYYLANNYDFKGSSITTSSALGLGSAPFTITGSLKNVGISTITSLDLNYQIDNGPVQTFAVSGLSVASLASYSFSHPTTWTPSASGYYKVKAWASNLNGNADQYIGNDTASKVVTVGSFLPTRRVVVEEGTGTWCTWCPRGAVYMDSLELLYPNTSIGVAVHNGANDPMKNATYDAGVTSFPGFTGFPSVIIDRKTVDDPNQVLVLHNKYLADFGFADLAVTATFDNVTRQLTANASAHLAISLTGSYNLALILTEDNVTGTTSGYNQVNIYAGGGQGPMGGFELLPNPVPASMMVYNHVGREISGGFNGQSGSLPGTLVDGTTYNYTFNYTVPAAYNIANMNAYVVMIDVASKEIMNGNKGSIVTGIAEAHPNITDVAVYPNPVVSDLLNFSISAKKDINVKAEITDMMGRKVMEQNYGKMGAGSTNHTLRLHNVPAGIYSLTILTGEDIVVRKFVVE